MHPRYVEEFRSAKESDLHNLPANNDLMQTRHTMHEDLEWDQYHFNVVSKQLTHSLGTYNSMLTPPASPSGLQRTTRTGTTRNSGRV